MHLKKKKKKKFILLFFILPYHAAEVPSLSQLQHLSNMNGTWFLDEPTKIQDLNISDHRVQEVCHPMC